MNNMFRFCIALMLAQLLWVDSLHAKSIFEGGFESCVPGKHVTWDGGGDGVSWFDAANWTGDLLPSNGDSVSIQMPGQQVIRFDNLFETMSIRCLSSNQALSIIAGNLEIMESGTVSPVITITGGALVATGDLQVVSSP